MRAFFPRNAPAHPIFRAVPAAALLAAVAVAPAGAEPAEKKNGIDYTKPFIYDRANDVDPFGTGRSETSALDKLLKEDKHREALKTTRVLLGKNDLTPEERSGLLTLAARLEVELGTHGRAIRKTEAAIRNGGLSDAQRADHFLFLSRLYLAAQPPDFAKAVEYQRKYNETTGGRRNTGR